MAEFLKTSIIINRINAYPKDQPFGPSWQKAVRKSPWLEQKHFQWLVDRYPECGNPQITEIISNHQNWDSLSSYLAELTSDKFAQKIHADMQDGMVRYDSVCQYDKAEQREYGREITLFSWNRPLTRVATHIDITVNGKISEQHCARIKTYLGNPVQTRRTENSISFLCPGSPAHVDDQIGAIIYGGSFRPSW